MTSEQGSRSGGRRRVAAIVAIVAVVVALGAVALRPRPIRIGVSISQDTSLGFEAARAIRFYVERNPVVAGRPVELVIETPTLEEADQRRAYRAVAERGARVVLAACVSSTAAWCAEEADATGVPCFSVSASTAALTGRRDRFFRIVVDTAACGHQAGEQLAREHRRLVVLTGTTNRAYTEALGAAVEAGFSGDCLRLSLGDEAEALGRMRAFQPDAVFLAVPPDVLVRLARTLRTELPDLSVTSSDWGLFALALYDPINLEGVSFLSQNGAPTPRYASLKAGFAEAYEHVPAHTSLYCFSILDVLYAGLEAVGDDPAALTAWLAQPRTYDYAFGRLHIDANGDAIREHFYLYTVREAKLTEVERVPVAAFPGGE